MGPVRERKVLLMSASSEDLWTVNTSTGELLWSVQVGRQKVVFFMICCLLSYREMVLFVKKV